jgi:hypothetical protein
MTTSMSITQGLAELKLLDKRINKLINGGSKSAYDNEPCFLFIDVHTKTHPVDTESLKKSATSNYQSFNDLVNRYSLIKRAIILKNATTLVNIGEWTGTVAEAIEQKSSIQYKKKLMEQMKRQYVAAAEKKTVEKNDLVNRLDKLLSSEMGKDVRTNPETVNAITVSFEENNKVLLVDPINSLNVIHQLENEVDAFLTNVDWVLSEVNGKTLITI